VTSTDPASSHPVATANYAYFLDDAAFQETDRPGFRRRVVNGEHLQLWFWRIAGGATGSVLHRHDENEQIGIVVRGALDFRIGDPMSTERTVLHEGDIYLAPFGVWHGDSIFVGDTEHDECWIIDVFAPPRADVAKHEVSK
jgi:quercetin dioxygenase-like cupin family protein